MKPIERLNAVAQRQAYDRPPFCDNEWSEMLREMVPYLAGCSPRADGRYTEEERVAAVRASADMVPWHQVYDSHFPVLGEIPQPRAQEPTVDEDGFVRVPHGFTQWVVSRPFSDAPGFVAYLQRKTAELRSASPSLPADFPARLAHARAMLGDTVIGFPYMPVGLDALYPLAGWDLLSPVVVESPEVIAEYLDVVADERVKRVHLYAEHITAADCPVALLYSDIAWNGGLLLSPRFLRVALKPALRKTTAAYHEHGIKVVYHSEGDIHQFLDDIIEAGLDGINPLSPSEHMDAVEIRKQYPDLILWGGIDERAILVAGSPADVRREVQRVGRGTGYGLIMGSSGGVHPACPVENLLAMTEALHGLASSGDLRGGKRWRPVR